MDDILRKYGQLLGTVDEWFARCVAQAGEHISCAKGCSECCRGLFDITLLDAAYLKSGFDRLEEEVKVRVLAQCRERLALMRIHWPEFDEPYILNHRPEEEWEILMPDDDETPCPLLGDDGRCLVYDYRPMTCRLHGLPLVDFSGEVLHDEWCTLNFVGEDALTEQLVRGEFTELFREELRQFRFFTERLLGRTHNELDTFIPVALLLDFHRFDWKSFDKSLT